MSDDVDYLPDNFNETIDDKLARKKAVTLERASKLQPLQAIFVNHLFECNMDIAIAAQRTGVKTLKARSWVETAGPTSDLIGSRLEELAKQSKVTVDVIVQGLFAEANRMPEHDEDKTVSMAARVSAWSHLAKYKGMFDKGNKGGTQNGLVNIDVTGDAAISGGE
ncbi:hypothetical protein KAR91_12805 [Candidatus Pacearchaeota archaeon]|nr:hypothetical protein [Candidatus Pacearchaeota archaeon]